MHPDGSTTATVASSHCFQQAYSSLYSGSTNCPRWLADIVHSKYSICLLANADFDNFFVVAITNYKVDKSCAKYS